MANALPDRLRIDAIGHATAQAVTRDGSRYIGHARATLLRPSAGSEAESRLRVSDRIRTRDTQN